MAISETTTKYKLIYIISIPDDYHKGLLKIGDATISTADDPSVLVPNCNALNQAARARIKQYTATAGIKYTLHHTELAVRFKTTSFGTYPESFRDTDVHSVLTASGIRQIKPNRKTGDEWFETDLPTAVNAIKAVKENRTSLLSTEIHPDNKPVIVFREEQLDAIRKTVKLFKKQNDMLWYAKMRFGKTLTALKVVQEMQFRRVIIVTHRPVVGEGWGEDFHKIFPGESEHDYSFEYKTQDSAYTFDEKIDYENDLKIRRLDKSGAYFIYFASIQDLRGSKVVKPDGYNKNNAVFDLDWDLIIVDEAHEGTQTELGSNVLKLLRKKHTKVLDLSGTPFNLLSQYDEESVYTWDYVMEQRCKANWDIEHPGDHNPYADLPKMHIFTYDLGEKLKEYVTDEFGSKAFNFREFFRVWSKGPHGKREIPAGAVEGNFVHEKDVWSFLNLMVKEDENSNYPFASQEYRDMFRHTLWMVPGVKEARALEGILRQHPVFKTFGIANVAGEGDYYEKDNYDSALDKVKTIIRDNPYSITLSCGKLTTGVTVKEWTAVLMLSGSYTTAAAQYMQTIFRVQSAGQIEGKQKTDCYVFDFAPDRTLRVLTETVHLSRKPGRSEQKRRAAMAEFLNYCPVISITGSRTKKYSVESMMEQVKQIYAERAVNSGFDDESIYNDELLKLDKLDASMFNKLKDIIGSSKAQKKKGEVVVNGQGLNDEQIETIDDPDQPDVPERTPLTPEEIAERQRIKQAKEARKKAIDILRGISIRMPLMIYGANVPLEEDITIEHFLDIVDDSSWEEFMPKGVTKKLFKDFTKYYDRDVFIAAGKRIRRLAAAADKETPTKRVMMIAEIFRHFKNPDKETVLTPWRVVNMHMSDTLGGWCFFNDKFEDDTDTERRRLEEPRFVDRGEVTKTVFDEKAKILEINSKSGLYPLYVAYSFYRQKLEDTVDDDWEPDELQYFWDETIRDNVFVICKTPMAKTITKRTLCGYSSAQMNGHSFDDLINQLKEKPGQFKSKVLREKYWKKGDATMKFDAIVGNPPYQAQLGGASPLPIYQLFVESAISISPTYVSMITPSRWLSAGNGLDEYRSKMLHDDRLSSYHDFYSALDIFPNVEIKGGIGYFLWDINHHGKCNVTTHLSDGTVMTSYRNMVEEGMDSFVRNPEVISIFKKVRAFGEDSFSEIISSRDPFGYDIRIPGSMKVAPHKYVLKKDSENCIEFYYNGWRKEGVGYVARDSVNDNQQWIDKYKVLIPKAWGVGNLSKDWLNPFIATPESVCTETYLVVGPFDDDDQAKNVVSYIKTKFFHLMVSINKISQNAAKGVYKHVPMQDFSREWTDSALYSKYGLTDNEIAFVEASIPIKGDASYYEKLLLSTYVDDIKVLLNKYGPAKHDYFKDTGCTQKNKLVSRTAEGLHCHHIDEDKAIMLSHPEYAQKNPFDYQKADRLVYCNLLEHFLLHVKIAEEPRNEEANLGEAPGIGGAVNYICRDLNSIYSGKGLPNQPEAVVNAVKDDFDDYVRILRRLWKIIEDNPSYKLVVTKESLCKDSDGNVVPAVLNALNGEE